MSNTCHYFVFTLSGKQHFIHTYVYILQTNIRITNNTLNKTLYKFDVAVNYCIALIKEICGCITYVCVHIFEFIISKYVHLKVLHSNLAIK